MKTRTLFAAIATVAIVIGSGSAAYAYHGQGQGQGYRHNGGQGYGQGNCYGYNQSGTPLTAEKQAAIQGILKESDKRIDPLMEQMHAKRMELDALSGNASVKPEAISKLASEIAALQTQIRNEMDARNEKLGADGAGFGPGYGYGMGNGRHGGNRGNRGHGGGHGSGCNWW